jgi:NAD(P)-dependent dehydrogenase (short-subunit alcohol dehydrogenase family)
MGALRGSSQHTGLIGRKVQLRTTNKFYVKRGNVESETMAGKVCLITGGSRGIGQEAAVDLAGMGATVVIVARDATRGEAVVAEIKAKTGYTAGLLLADLSSLEDVRKVAREFRARYDRLDVLVNNAGAVFSRRSVTVDGLERTFALNHLAYFLLTNLLIDLLRTDAPSRVVNVSSTAHKGAVLDFDDLQIEQKYSGWRAYGRSKLANILFTHELARRLQGTGVTANSLHPGVVSTGFNKNNGILMRLAMTVARPFLISPQKGAQTIVYLASSPEVAGVTGEYFINCTATTSSPVSYDDEAARRLWEISARLTRLSGS